MAIQRFPWLLGALCLLLAARVLAQSEPAPAGGKETGLRAELQAKTAAVAAEISAAEAELSAQSVTEAARKALQSRVETLRQIDYALSLQKLAVDENDALTRELDAMSEQLQRLRQVGLEESLPIPVRVLDAGADALESALARAESVRLEIAAAEASAEAADAFVLAATRERREVRDELEKQSDPLEVARLQAELERLRLAERAAKALADLRAAELATKQLQQELAGRNVEYLRERFARLRAATIFDREQLDKILAELAATERKLRAEVAAADKSGRRLESRPDSQAAAIQANQQTRRLLARQLERVAASRVSWERRYELLSGTASRELVREWAAQAADSLRLLSQEQDALRARLTESITNLQSLQSKAAGRAAIDQAQNLVKTLEQEFAALTALRRLQQRILDEATAVLDEVSFDERVRDVGAGILGVWRYELMEVEDRSITIGTAISAILLLVLGVLLSRVLSQLLGVRLLRRLGLQEGTATAYQMLAFYFLVAFFVLFALRTLNVPLTIFTVAGGALAIGVGFGSQNILNNFISGLILLAERPIRIGDMVDVDGTYGSVVHVGLRSTSVRSFSNVDIIVPNSTFLEKNVVNWTLSDDLIRVNVNVGVAYGSPARTVRDLIGEAVKAHPKVLQSPEPIILFAEFGDNALHFEVHFWIRMKKLMDRRVVESDLRYQIDELFAQAGIVIAFPQRDVHLDTPEPLRVRLLRDRDTGQRGVPADDV